MSMEIGNILEFFENKSIFITGGTGFIAKILIEKILRIQPNVKRLYVLIRAPDDKSASQRLQNELIDKGLFRVLREKWGGNINKFISEKVVAIPGDITVGEELGVNDPFLVNEMLREVDVIVNLAATTNFDERYDISFRLNALGPNNILSFAKKCAKMKVFVHVSTAYVSGEKGGLILETPYHMGEALNGKSGLDIFNEQEILETRMNQLRSAAASKSEITLTLKDLGIQRAQMYGWPNTYVFTKAMGEMLIGKFKGNVPVVVIRPTIVTSTYREPFPGWVEGFRTVDSVVIGYGKGKMSCMAGDVNMISDLIPADMVVNSIFVAVVAHANDISSGLNIYHIGSSFKNPIMNQTLQNLTTSYFTDHPLIGKNGKPIRPGKLHVLPTMESYHRYIWIRYLLPIKGLEIANKIFCECFKGMHTEMSRKIKYVMRLVELYKPYIFFQGVFDDMNAERLRIAAKESRIDLDMFDFDPNNIDWVEYYRDIHLPGLVKYVFK